MVRILLRILISWIMITEEYSYTRGRVNLRLCDELVLSRAVIAHDNELQPIPSERRKERRL